MSHLAQGTGVSDPCVGILPLNGDGQVAIGFHAHTSSSHCGHKAAAAETQQVVC